MTKLTFLLALLLSTLLALGTPLAVADGSDEPAVEQSADDGATDCDLDADCESDDASADEDDPCAFEFTADVVEDDSADEEDSADADDDVPGDDGEIFDCQEIAPGVVVHDVTDATIEGALRDGIIDGGDVDLPAAGSVERDLTAAGGRASSARKARRPVLGTARARVAGAGTVHMPIRLTGAGRKTLRAARGTVRFKVATTIVLDGTRITYTKTLVLRHTKKQPARKRK